MQHSFLHHFEFLSADQDSSSALAASYSPYLVILSVLVAIFSAYTAFLVSGRWRESKEHNVRYLWLFLGATALGIGVWAMHFIGMLAYQLPIGVGYDIKLTILSILPAIFSSLVVLMTSDANVKAGRLIIIQSVLMGLGIGFMHYIGMMAMIFEGRMYYDLEVFILSILLAVLLSQIALRMKIWADHNYVSGQHFSIKLLLPAIMMGIAISAMHYTGMFAMEVFANPGSIEHTSTWSTTTLIYVIASAVFGVGMLLIAALELSYRYELFQRIKTSEIKQGVILSTVGDAIISCDNKGCLQLFNLAAEEVFGYAECEVIGKHISMLIAEADADAIARMVHAIQPTSNQQDLPVGKLSGMRKDGSHFIMEVKLTPLSKSLEGGFVGILRDITQREAAEARIQHQANFDSLTDLPNRFLVFDRLTQLIKDAERSNTMVAIVFMDLDGFKYINDSLGHDVGDQLLIEASNRLSDITRSADTVGRLGGDEFILLAGGLKFANKASPVVENLLEAFRKPFLLNDRSLTLTCSAGAAIYPVDGTEPSELLRKADAAMYHAKDSGKNTYAYFTEEMNHSVARRLLLEDQLHQAVDKQQFEVHYQPKVELKTGQIIGAEALIRWPSQVLGMVSPDEFIPICEQIGLIESIGQFVITEALETASLFQLQGMPAFTVAVNISPRQFKDNTIIEFIRSELGRLDLEGDVLELELTEGLLIDSSSNVYELFGQLQELGVSIAMDDFGTGYSSLSYLRQYPFDVLKIDREFIRDILDDPSDRELTVAAIAMAHALKLKVVAEGIETCEQLEALKAMGCDYGQGYFIGKPMPCGAFEELFLASYLRPQLA